METDTDLLRISWTTARPPTMLRFLMLQLLYKTDEDTKGRQPLDGTSLLEWRMDHSSDTLWKTWSNPILFKLLSMLLLKVLTMRLTSLGGGLIPSITEMLLLLQSSPVCRLLPISMVWRYELPLNMLFALMISTGIDYDKKTYTKRCTIYPLPLRYSQLAHPCLLDRRIHLDTSYGM